MLLETGTRPELVARLRELSEGWWHLGKDRFCLESLAAAEQIGAGESEVTVGHTTFRVLTSEVIRNPIDAEN